MQFLSDKRNDVDAVGVCALDESLHYLFCVHLFVVTNENVLEQNIGLKISAMCYTDGGVFSSWSPETSTCMGNTSLLLCYVNVTPHFENRTTEIISRK
jgi:hypothetical protein